MFLDFISYSGGPLPEDLLAVVKVPVQIAWGVEDPWEPMEQGKAFAEFDSVEVRSNAQHGHQGAGQGVCAAARTALACL